MKRLSYPKLLSKEHLLIPPIASGPSSCDKCLTQVFFLSFCFWISPNWSGLFLTLHSFLVCSVDQTRAHFHLNYLSHLHPSWVSFHETLGNSQGLPPFLRSSLAFRISSVGRCCHLDFTFTGKGLECQEFERVSDSLLQI